ncbi:MAG: HAD-IC family P-type ATPase, partial [Planctomycetales bacterium]|nr:HAD-IC family P-type ATPase [Planctomycetales bacterium]
MASGPSSTPKRGLSSAEVLQSREKHGSNLLTPPQRDPWWKLFLEKFDDPIIRILLIAAIVAIAVGAMHGEYLEGIGILAAVFLATIIAFVNEFRANQEFDILNAVNDEVPTRVLRDGGFTTVPKHEVVVGDWVLIEAGEEVPADGELVEAVSLSVNESGLTGESEPVGKVTAEHPDFSRRAERTYPHDAVLRGCMVLDGHGTFRVTKVGDATEIGQTVRAAAEETGDDTPLNQQLERLSKVIGVVGLVVAVALFAALVVRGVINGELQLDAGQWLLVGLVMVSGGLATLRIWLPMIYDGLELACGLEAPEWLSSELTSSQAMTQRLKLWGGGGLLLVAGIAIGWGTGFLSSDYRQWLPSEAVEQFLAFFMVAVTIIVVAVPEGLAMSVTLSLAYSMRRMTAANTLVRKMHACETIGAATVICSDKTGTLTLNEMRVFEAVYPALTDKPRVEDSVGQLIIENIAANSTAHLTREAGQLKGLGNPTESALLLWLNGHDVDYVLARDAFEIKGQLTFSTDRKWMGTCGMSPAGMIRLHVKGAPEIVLARCGTMLTADGEQGLTPEQRAELLAELGTFQQRGMRTLGMAYRAANAETPGVDIDQAAHDLVWLGFLAIADPIRPEVPEAVAACRKAGIKIKMVTGDSQPTAQEIGRQIGLWDPSLPSHSHIGGPSFQELEEEPARDAAENLMVMSRA